MPRFSLRRGSSADQPLAGLEAATASAKAAQQHAVELAEAAEMAEVARIEEEAGAAATVLAVATGKADDRKARYTRDAYWRQLNANLAKRAAETAAAELAVAEAKRAILVAARDMESTDAARSLKLLFFVDRLLFAQPAGFHGNRAKGKSIDTVVSGRLRKFWRGEWDAMWREAAVEGEGRGREKNPESEKTRLQANARRIETLLMENEKSKAAACVAKAASLAADSGWLQQLRGLFPEKTQPCPHLHQLGRETGPEAEELWASLATGIARQISKIPRLSSPGPSVSRFEHWGRRQPRCRRGAGKPCHGKGARGRKESVPVW